MKRFSGNFLQRVNNFMHPIPFLHSRFLGSYDVDIMGHSLHSSVQAFARSIAQEPRTYVIRWNRITFTNRMTLSNDYVNTVMS